MSLFGAFLATAAPEMFTCVPPSSKVGRMTLIASPHSLLLGAAGAAPHQADIVGVGRGRCRRCRRGCRGRRRGRRRRAVRARLALTPVEPGLGRLLAVLGDIGGDQRGVVGMLAGADADLALPLRVGELLVGEAPRCRGPSRRRATRARIDSANQWPFGSRRFAGTAASSAADWIGWVTPLSTRSTRLPIVDRHQHVGRRVRAFGRDALRRGRP